MGQKIKNAIIKSLGGWCANLSASWAILAFVTPNFLSFNQEVLQTLTVDLGFATLFLGLTVFFEFIQK